MSPERDLEDKLIEKIEELEEKVERQEQKIEELEGKKAQGVERQDNSTEISRRSFLKKFGAGAIGLGALSLAPAASKVTITDTGVKKDGSSLWFSGLTSNYDVSGQNITDSGTVIWDSTNSQIPASRIEQGAGSGLDADTVDGKQASDLGNIKRDKNGTADIRSTKSYPLSTVITLPSGGTTYYTKASTTLTNGGGATATLTGVSGSTVSLSGTVHFGITDSDSNNGVIGTIYRNGSTIASTQPLYSTGPVTQTQSEFPVTTTLTAVSNDSVTFYAGTTGMGNTHTVTVKGWVKASNTGTATGTVTVTTRPSNTTSPAFMDRTVNPPANGNWNTSTFLNGGSFTTGAVLPSLTTAQTFSFQISYSNVTTTTTWTGSFQFPLGSYI